jgi:ABC-type bacteriocin/lantibiotic exporter with double-glycine peptidase domain
MRRSARRASGRAGRRALLSDLLSAAAGRTVLLITHDPDGLDQVDQVIALDGGKVAGSHPARVAIDVSGQPYLEREAAAMLARE